MTKSEHRQTFEEVHGAVYEIITTTRPSWTACGKLYGASARDAARRKSGRAAMAGQTSPRPDGDHRGRSDQDHLDADLGKAKQ
jgi:hypothetical protein